MPSRNKAVGWKIIICIVFVIGFFAVDGKGILAEQESPKESLQSQGNISTTTPTPAPKLTKPANIIPDPGEAKSNSSNSSADSLMPNVTTETEYNASLAVVPEPPFVFAMLGMIAALAVFILCKKRVSLCH